MLVERGGDRVFSNMIFFLNISQIIQLLGRIPTHGIYNKHNKPIILLMFNYQINNV